MFEHRLHPTLYGVDVQSLSKLKGSSNRSEMVIQSLRQNTLQELNTDWTDLVRYHLGRSRWQTFVGRSASIRASIETGSTGIHPLGVYKSENKDVFQRRNRKRSR